VTNNIYDLKLQAPLFRTSRWPGSSSSGLLTDWPGSNVRCSNWMGEPSAATRSPEWTLPCYDRLT